MGDDEQKLRERRVGRDGRCRYDPESKARLVGNGDHTISAEMRDVETAGRHLIDVRADTDEVTKVDLDIRFKRIRVLPPIGKKKRYPALDLTVIHAVEPNPPAGRKRIEWKLLTDLEVHSCDDAVEKIKQTVQKLFG